MTFADAHEVGVTVGYVFGMMAIPLTGLVLLIVGLVQRSRARAQPDWPVARGYPGYPAPGSYAVGYPPPPGAPPFSPGYPPPPGAPVSPGYLYPPAWAPTAGNDPRFLTRFPPPPRRSSGTTLIIVGSVLLALGLLGILGNATRMDSTHSDRHGYIPSHHGVSVAHQSQ